MNLKKFLIEHPFGVVILAILSGIATNLLSSSVPILYPFLARNVSIQIWTIILLVFLGFFVALFPASFILKRNYKAYKSEYEAHQKTQKDLDLEKQGHQATKLDYETEKKIVEIDRKLLDSVSRLAKGNNVGQEFDILIENILQTISRMYPLIDSGISIFCPDTKDKNYLIPWRACFAESQKTMRFYIGSTSDEKRGVAGEVYKEKSMQIVHVEVDKDGKIRSDNSLYIIFPGQEIPKYRSFICVPIIDTDGNSLGVLSIDSQDKLAFDSDKSQELVNLIASRFSAILVVALNIPPEQAGTISPGSVA
jgi:transcriptional regulator with GAF, ATPase, and Fis domain